MNTEIKSLVPIVAKNTTSVGIIPITKQRRLIPLFLIYDTNKIFFNDFIANPV